MTSKQLADKLIELLGWNFYPSHDRMSVAIPEYWEHADDGRLAWSHEELMEQIREDVAKLKMLQHKYAN